jgi:hypothetical protein
MLLPKQDHYEVALGAALRRLRERLDADRLRLLRARVSGDCNTIVLPALCWEFEVRTEPLAISLLPQRCQVSIVWQILVLDYLGAEHPAPPVRFVSFADFPDGRGYQSAFEARVIRRLDRMLGRDPGALPRAAERLGAVPVGRLAHAESSSSASAGAPGSVRLPGEGDGPVRCIFRFFPLLEFQVVRHPGDGDFPPSCNMLFSDNLLSIFTMEDGIVAAERLVSVIEGKTPAASKPG